MSDTPDGLITPLLIALANTALVVIVGTLAGHAFARIEFPGRRRLLITLMSLWLLPAIVLVVPFFVMTTRIGLFDTRHGLILVYTAINAPFAVWLLSVFFQSVPRQLDAAARVDGCSRFHVLYRIYIPLWVPEVGTVAILGFLTGWKEFLFAVTLAFTTEAKTTPAGLAPMQAAFQTRWAAMTAGATLVSLPALLIVLFAQRYIVQGLTFGAFKG